jgi:23S rRNA (uracil1939-C5)-methyltransferase
MSSELIVRLEKWAYGGETLGRLGDGRAVFVPFTLPGERVRLRLVEEKRGFARGELLEVLEPSPQRVEPKCRHFGRCGGCHYQHLSYPAQLAAKEQILHDQLTRIGGLPDPPVAPAVPSPDAWYYRNHLQFHLTDEGRPGFIAWSVPGEQAGPFAIQECHLPAGPLGALWPELDFEPGAPFERVALRLGADEDLMLVLEAEEPAPPEVEVQAGISVVHLLAGQALVLAGDDHLVIEVLGRRFRVSAGSFFQVNTAMAAEMVKHLLEVLPLPQARIVDVYCGVGLFSAFLAPHCRQLTGVELSPPACVDFETNLAGYDHVELYEADAGQALPHLQPGPEILLVDPPRAGLDRRALQAVLDLQSETLAYISCDPSTLARDARHLLAGGYRLRRVTPFDLFPQTYHIESISLFTH